VERSIWTDNMLAALETGVKGGVWFSLIDKVYRPSTLNAAWLKVKANKGSAGSDHQSIEDFERNLKDNLDRLYHELQDGSYRPRPILRVHIDKPGSKDKRPLGIPCVRDRVVQAALRLVIEPIFEKEFVQGSYGFRPGRGCKDALREVERLLKAGYVHVVDADLKSYFDSIPHDELLSETGSYIADGRLLALIEAFLTQDILENMALWTPEKGAPQGAVVSPLLSNLYLHSIDVAVAQAGYHMVRYADDCAPRRRRKESVN
jgi:RNA-directed DNA polymerase